MPAPDTTKAEAEQELAKTVTDVENQMNPKDHIETVSKESKNTVDIPDDYQTTRGLEE